MKDKWISVDERLPDKTGKYMVRAFWGAINPKRREEPALFKYNEKRGDGRFQYGFDWCTITHWKPIEPPEVSHE